MSPMTLCSPHVLWGADGYDIELQSLLQSALAQITQLMPCLPRLPCSLNAYQSTALSWCHGCPCHPYGSEHMYNNKSDRLVIVCPGAHVLFCCALPACGPCDHFKAPVTLSDNAHQVSDVLAGQCKTRSDMSPCPLDHQPRLGIAFVALSTAWPS